VSLDGKSISEQTLHTGGVYTFLIVEENDNIVSKDSLFQFISSF